MGTSEHYCLRWNNHQNNLLGVFSQLLRDESLVDVTLACSEGHSIRAHRVVLSACSSYFQTLFVDHPSRHPIVILKDVRFAELRTLIEFMYRGEVNVEYCQLSALLKTAESLKVKGLAEMTNLSSSSTTTSSSSITSPIVPSNSASSVAGLSGTPTATVTSQHENPTLPPPSATSTVRMSGSVVDHIDQRVLLEREHLAQRERERESRELHMNERGERERIDRVGEHVMKTEPVDIPSHHQRLSALVDDAQGHTTSSSTPPPQSRRQCSSASPPPLPSQQTSTIINRRMGPLSSSSEDTGRGHNNDDGGGSGVMSPRPPLDHHDQDSVVNLTTSSCSTTSTAERTAPSDLSVQQTNNNNSSSTIGPPPSCSSSSRIPSASPGHHHDTEPIAGPSGLPPVQQVPLSLKKEADWGGGMSEEKSLVDPDYSRHPYDQDMLSIEGTSSSFPCMYCGATFQHQSKLTRHILSHSLETLKYREQLHLQGLPPGLAGVPPEALSAFSRGAPSHDPTSMKCDPGSSTTSGSGPDYSAMDLDLEAAAAASAGAGSSGVLCKFCGKSFPDVGSLIAHLPVHTGDRPFKCEFCGKAFKLRHHMKDHCRVHTGERPFRCALCGKTFSRSTILKAHEKTHYPKYVRKFLSPSPLDTEEENNPHQ